MTPYGAPANTYTAGSIPIFSLTGAVEPPASYDNPVTSWPVAGAWDFCAAFDTASCSLGALAGFSTEILPWQSLFLCSTDLNGPVNPNASAGQSPTTPNGIPDGEFELGLLAAVLNNTYALDPARTGGITNAQVLSTFEANFNYFKVLITEGLGNVQLNTPPSPPSDLRSLIPGLMPWYPGSLAVVLAGYATEGDAESLAALDALLGQSPLGGFLLPLPPAGGVGAYTTGFPGIFGPDGDADGDGFTNRQEYDHFNARGAAVTIAAQLDPTTTPLQQGPVIIACAAGGTIQANASCEALVPDLTPGLSATEAGGGRLTVTQSPAAGATVGRGDIPVILTVTDELGHFATCEALLTVADTTPPEITLNGDPVLTVDARANKCLQPGGDRRLRDEAPIEPANFERPLI